MYQGHGIQASFGLCKGQCYRIRCNSPKPQIEEASHYLEVVLDPVVNLFEEGLSLIHQLLQAKIPDLIQKLGVIVFRTEPSPKPYQDRSD